MKTLLVKLVSAFSLSIMLASAPSLADQADVAARESGYTDAAKIKEYAEISRNLTTVMQRLGYSITIDDIWRINDTGVFFGISYHTSPDNRNNLETRFQTNPNRLFVTVGYSDSGTCYDLSTGNQRKVDWVDC